MIGTVVPGNSDMMLTEKIPSSTTVGLRKENGFAVLGTKFTDSNEQVLVNEDLLLGSTSPNESNMTFVKRRIDVPELIPQLYGITKEVRAPGSNRRVQEKSRDKSETKEDMTLSIGKTTQQNNEDVS